MNLANRLTLSRIAIVPFFLVALVPDDFWIPAAWWPLLRVAALLFFIGASVTDYYDGLLARRHGWITNFGKLMDPLADKILVMAAFVGLVELEIFPAWMVVLVLAREFLITGLRLLAATQGRVLGADRWGKNKTISQLTTIITALVFLTARDWLEAAGLWERVVVRQWEIAWILTLVLHLMMFICVVLTVVSGWRYFARNLDIFKE
ncbi:MAG: CDP-diacylglycerol--glycerol-3-phosphate 3-phosphatidyltransferase [bacterium]|nr:CDP-diacylglycerol--glycerol-3-phosphate 3-phosphatidyltransferase [bacterium]